MRLQVLKETIPEAEDRVSRMIRERSGIEQVIAKIEAHDLDQKHSGLCGIAQPIASENLCERFYGHTGLHSWEGGGIG